jgi:thioredoxin reductase
MINKHNFDVVIVGGSYAGLAAAMALGRALKKVLIIDNGKPCNSQTPYSHNFLTNDGRAPAEIARVAKSQVAKYDTVKFFTGTAITANKEGGTFNVEVATGEKFGADKLVFATGIKDNLPPIDGVAECWGISVLHCPYCHGYEVRNKETAVLGNGENGFDFIKLISGWTDDLMLFTNGASALSAEQNEKLHAHDIGVIEQEIEKLEHSDGYITNVIFRDGTRINIDALYAPGPFGQHCTIPESLGCELTEEGYIKIDSFQETTIAGVYAIGDNASKMRTIANAVAMGTAAGMVINKRVNNKIM